MVLLATFSLREGFEIDDVVARVEEILLKDNS